MNKNRAKNKSSKGFTALMAVIVVAVLALGAYAVKKEYDETHPYVPTTVADFAKEAGMTSEEFMKKWEIDGIEGIDEKTDMTDAQKKMSVVKSAEFNGMSYADYAAEVGYSSQMPDNITVEEAQDWVKASKIAEMNGMSYDEFLEFYGLTAEQVPEDMPYKDADPIVSEAWNNIPISKFLEQDGMTFEEFLEQTGLEEGKVTPETLMKDVQALLSETAE